VVAQIDVLDAACDPHLELVLRRAYTSHILAKEVVQRGGALRELYEREGDAGPLRDALTTEEQGQVVRELSALRREVNANVRVVFEGDDGPWVGGSLNSEERKRLAAELTAIRRHPMDVPMDLHGDPYFRDVFDREPDAWLVFGGDDDEAIIVSEPEKRKREMDTQCHPYRTPRALPGVT
jgi:hypothetical protein